MADISSIQVPNGDSYDIKDSTARSGLAGKQDTLVSGTNIKTVNGNSLLGSGDITISGGGAVSGVKGDAESTYRTGNVNLTAANIGAVDLDDKYTRSSVGTLDWTSQTDGDAKVIAKSALAFWNGAYSGSSSNLS